MKLQPKNCDRCDEQLGKDGPFYIHIGVILSKAVCSNCHRDYIRMVEDLFSSRKITSGSTEENIRMVKTSMEWFNAPVTQG